MATVAITTTERQVIIEMGTVKTVYAKGALIYALHESSVQLKNFPRQGEHLYVSYGNVTVNGTILTKDNAVELTEDAAPNRGQAGGTGNGGDGNSSYPKYRVETIDWATLTALNITPNSLCSVEKTGELYWTYAYNSPIGAYMCFGVNLTRPDAPGVPTIETLRITPAGIERWRYARGADVPLPPADCNYELKSVGGKIMWIGDNITHPLSEIHSGDRVTDMSIENIDPNMTLASDYYQLLKFTDEYRLTVVTQEWTEGNGSAKIGVIGLRDYGGEIAAVWRFDTGWQPSWNFQYSDGEAERFASWDSATKTLTLSPVDTVTQVNSFDGMFDGIISIRNSFNA